MNGKAGGNVEYRTRVSFVWSYEKDEAWLTGLSAQGLHLVKPGLFRNRFERAVDRRYVYKVDYRQLKDPKELLAYLALFEDMGWEHAGTIMGWHYFRKPYPEGEADAIYSDPASIIQLWKRVQLTLLMLALANVPIFILNVTNMLHSGDRSQTILRTIAFASILQALAILLLLYGWFRFQRKIKRLNDESK